MARIIYATDYVSQRKLSDNVRAKHTADGAVSPLIAMLAENNIDLAANALAALQADTHETQRHKHARNAEAFEQAARLTVKSLTKNVRGIAQFLKKFYHNDIQKLGAWSITVNGSRIVIPATPDGLRTLIDAIRTKHGTFVPPNVSPLAVFLTENPKIDLALMADDAQQAISDNDAAQAERLQKWLKTKNSSASTNFKPYNTNISHSNTNISPSNTNISHSNTNISHSNTNIITSNTNISPNLGVAGANLSVTDAIDSV